MTDEPLRAQRLAAQQLAGPPAATVEAVVHRLLAVQGQDPRGVRLAVRARSSGLTAADVDHALTASRSVLISWLNRGTLHLVTAEDYWWLHDLTTPPMRSGNTRRLAQEGVPPADAERAVTVVERALAADGPLTRAQLRERITAAGVRTQGQALVHILALASLRGLIVRGPMAGREQAFVLVRDWLGRPPPALARDTALAELARRYLIGHGPAAEQDLAKWAGLPLRDARRGLAAIAAGLAPRPDGLAELAGQPQRPGLPPPRLLGAFDPVLLGWVARDSLLGRHQALITVNGLFRPFALVRGRAAGSWRITGGQVTIPPLDGPPTAAESAALAAEAADVARFLGL
jgi:DNA glycosylase AlkZ-like